MTLCWGRRDTSLAASTLPFATNCKRCQRWYAAFKSRWSTWSVFPRPSDDVQDSVTIDIPHHVAILAQSFPHTINTSLCRTQKPTKLFELVSGLKIAVETLETHGGMGRIYTLKDPSRVLKVADLKTSWCRYEPGNYRTLEANNIPCATMYADCRRPLDNTVFVLMILERLEFTMTAFIRAAGRAKEDPRKISIILKALLRMLENANLAYGDLSPENIMFRCCSSESSSDSTSASPSPPPTNLFEIALIDPQFLVPLDEFRQGMTARKADAFDTTYLALKIQIIGILDPPIRKFTESICADILGYVPKEQQTRHWLVHDAPVGLFVAYDILYRKHRTTA